MNRWILLWVIIIEISSEFSPLHKFLNTKVPLHLDSDVNTCYWHYSGDLSNPLSGKVFAGIEGLEIVSRSRLQPLQYNSSKIFVYVESENRSHLMKSFRFSQTAPERSVSHVHRLNQIISVEESSNSSRNRGFKYFSLFPGGRRLKSSHIEISSFTEDGICQTAISNYLKVQPRQIQNRFISFSSHNQGYGGRTQEQYTFTTTSRRHRHFFQHFFHNLVSASKSESITDSIARLKYRRIGEGPSWFSTGKLCVSDLTGTRYCSMEDLPEGVRILLASADPTFFEPLNGNSSVYESTDPLNLFISNSNSKTLMEKILSVF